MPTPDASQFTQKKKYEAIQERELTGGPKLVTHLYQFVPRASGLVDFLPSFTNKLTSATPRYVRPDIITGLSRKLRIPPIS